LCFRVLMLLLEHSRSDHLLSATFGALSQLACFPFVQQLFPKRFDLFVLATEKLRSAAFGSRLCMNALMLCCEALPYLSPDLRDNLWNTQELRVSCGETVIKCRQVRVLTCQHTAVRSHNCVDLSVRQMLRQTRSKVAIARLLALMTAAASATMYCIDAIQELEFSEIVAFSGLLNTKSPLLLRFGALAAVLATASERLLFPYGIDQKRALKGLAQPQAWHSCNVSECLAWARHSS
jgi:hypothetical protein